MFTIKVIFQQPGLAPVTLEAIEAGQSLLEVLLKHNIGLHHNCGGVCSCSSCHLYIQSGEDYLEEKSRREADFIKRAANPGRNSRLGCQCLLLNQVGNVNVVLPDQTGWD